MGNTAAKLIAKLFESLDIGVEGNPRLCVRWDYMLSFSGDSVVQLWQEQRVSTAGTGTDRGVQKDR